MDKKDILIQLKKLKSKYEQEGLIILGLFGSYANDTQNKFSDIDVVYKLDYDTFSQKYKDGFTKLLRINDIKSELQKIFKKKIDLVPGNNHSIIKGLIRV